MSLRRLIAAVLIIAESVLPLTAIAEDTLPTNEKPNPANNDAPPQPITDPISRLLADTRDLAMYADARKKLKLNPIDAREIDRWLATSAAIKDLKESDPDAYAAIEASGFTAIPPEIVEQLNLGDRPEAIFSKEVLEGIFLLVTNPTAHPAGAGGEYLEVSRLLADYDKDGKAISHEGEEKDPDIMAKAISAHFRDNVTAADLAAYDLILCTKITIEQDQTNSQLKVIKREKQDPIPIEFIWQAEKQNQNKLGGTRDGSLGPNGLGQLFGINPDDLLRRITSGSFLDQLLGLMRNGGWSLRPEDLLGGGFSGFGNRDPMDLMDRLGQALLADTLGASLGSHLLRLGPDLPTTVDQTGAAILAEAFPKLPPEAMQAATLEEWAERVGRIALGERLVDQGFVWEGNTAREIARNLAYQYLTNKVFLLAPTTELGGLPLGSPQAFRASLGRLATSQRLGLPLSALTPNDLKAALGYRWGNTLAADPGLVDQRLGLLAGTTERLIGGGLTPDQYFELVGDQIIKTTVGSYADDPQIWARAYGLSIDFGPEDVVLPDPAAYPAVADQLAFLDQFYRSFISDDDWQFLATRYRQPAFTDLDDDAEIKTWLATHATRNPDLLGPILTGAATDDTWVEIGLRAMAKLEPKPFTRVALLHYLKTGEILTQTTDGGFRAPLLDPDAVFVEKLGLLAGDIERIRTDRFITTILPRIAHDTFLEATGRQSAQTGSLFGLPRQTVRTDEFLLRGLDVFKTALESVPSSENLRGRVAQLSAADWRPSPTETRDQKIDRLLGELAAELSRLAGSLDAKTRWQATAPLAALVAGRDLLPLASYPTPTVAGNRSIGLTRETVNNLFQGRSSPNDVRRDLGANYLSSYIWNADDPAAMARDLKRLIANPTARAWQSFKQIYQGTLDETADLVNDTLGLVGGRGLSGAEFFEIFTGNRLPLFRTAGQTLHQALTGRAGTIFNANMDDLLAATGLNVLLGQNGWVGSLDLNNLAQDLPRLVFEESTGLVWRDNPTDLLKANGAAFLTMLGAPGDLANQFASVWNSQNPGKALEMLARREVWNRIPVAQTMTRAFGPLGAQMAGLLQGVFVDGQDPKAMLQNIAQNPEQFFPAIAQSFNLPFDPTGLYQAIKAGDGRAITQQLVAIGAPYLDQRLAGFVNLITSGADGKTILRTAINTLPSFVGGGAAGQVAAFAATMANYLLDGNVTSQQLLDAAGQFAASLGIPYVADALKIVSDPQGFGLGYASSVIAQQLNQAFGAGYISAETVRNALFGPDPRMFAAEAEALRAQLMTRTDFADLPSDVQDYWIRTELKPKMDAVRSEAQQNLMFSSIDAVAKLPPGFTKAMVRGTDEQRIDALFAMASRYANLPPEAVLVIDLIKSKGDLSRIADTTYGLIDQRLSQLVGVPLPAGFTKGVADVISGKQTFGQFADKMGNFAIAQVSGALDQKLGLPVGATYAVYQGARQLADASRIVAGLEKDLLSGNVMANLETYETKLQELAQANQQLGALKAQFAGMIIGIVAGKQIAQAERSLGLPAGTISFFLNAGLTAAFTGGSFMAVLGAAFPMFAGGMLLGKLLGGGFLGGLGGLFGGGGAQTAIWCSPAGFYPYWRPKDEKDAGTPEEEIEAMTFDPNPNLDKYEPDKRLKPEEVEEKLKIWPGYPGEFLGEESNAEHFTWGKKASARWKIREVTGNLLLLPQRLNDERMQPNQLILYNIPPGDRGDDGDYTRFYDGRETKDERFIHSNLVGDKLGIVDWPFPWDKDYPAPGYGNGTPHSGNAMHPDSAQQQRHNVFNLGLWVEKAEEYRHHIHYGG